MGQLRSMPPSMVVVAAFSQHPEALAWGRERLTNQFGPIALSSPEYSFHHTDYYQHAMGPGLTKILWAFERLASSDSLPELKLATNRLENDIAALGRFPEPRPLNLDPGLLQLGKFLLASTKDQAHRIYLRDGIFAEITLRFQEGAFHPWPWTYADYREPFVREFLVRAREWYRRVLSRENDQS